MSPSDRSSRLTPRKPPRKPSVGETKNGCVIRISTAYGKESERSEVAVVEEVIEGISITTDLHHDTLDLLHHGGNDHHSIIVDLRHEIMSILIYLVSSMDGGVIHVPDHLRFDDHSVDLCLAPGRRPQGDIEVVI